MAPLRVENDGFQRAPMIGIEVASRGDLAAKIAACPNEGGAEFGALGPKTGTLIVPTREHRAVHPDPPPPPLAPDF